MNAKKEKLTDRNLLCNTYSYDSPERPTIECSVEHEHEKVEPVDRMLDDSIKKLRSYSNITYKSPKKK